MDKLIKYSGLLSVIVLNIQLGAGLQEKKEVVSTIKLMDRKLTVLVHAVAPEDLANLLSQVKDINHEENSKVDVTPSDRKVYICGTSLFSGAGVGAYTEGTGSPSPDGSDHDGSNRLGNNPVLSERKRNQKHSSQLGALEG
jgi:hypothetical protein